MELRHLRYFKVLAEELNFRKAADKLGISQPPLSQQMRELEEELGTSLFLRLKTGNQLTEAGKLFYQYTLEILEHLGKATDHIKSLTDKDQGSLQLGIVSGTSGDRVGIIIQDFKKEKPGIDLQLTENCSATLIQMVRDEKLDVAIVYGPVVDEQLEWLPISQVTYVIIYGAPKPIDTLDELLSQPIIFYKKQDYPFLFDQLMHVFDARKIQPSIISELSSPRTRMLLVQQQLGVSFVSLELAQGNPLIHYKVIPDLPPVSVGIVTRKRRNAAGLQEMKAVISRVFTEEQ